MELKKIAIILIIILFSSQVNAELIKPNEKYFNDNLTSMFPFGLHEMEYSLSIVPLILLFFVF